MLNDLNILIGIEIELNIRGFTLPLFSHKSYYLTIFILLQLYINSKLSFFRKNY